jgi:hypothetical protein
LDALGVSVAVAGPDAVKNVQWQTVAAAKAKVSLGASGLSLGPPICAAANLLRAAKVRAGGQCRRLLPVKEG